MRLINRVAATCILLLASAAYAERVGINFTSTESDKSTLKADDKAGIDHTSQKHWNNLTVDGDDPNGHQNTGRKAVIKDSLGKDVKSMSVSVKATEHTQVFPSIGADWGFKEGNLTLVSGHVAPQPSITISGIPYKRYDVYVYLAAGAQAGVGSVTISLGKNAKGDLDKNTTYFYSVKWNDGAFAEAEALTLDDANNGGAANVVRFKGNTASAIVLDVDGKLGGGWSGVAAVQIVELADPKPEKKK